MKMHGLLKFAIFLTSITSPNMSLGKDTGKQSLQSRERDCYLNIDPKYFSNIENITTDYHFTWTGKCEDGFANGDGQLKILNGDWVLEIENLSKESGVYIRKGEIVAIDNFKLDDILTRYPYRINNCLRGHGGLDLKGNLNFESRVFQERLKDKIEHIANENCNNIEGVKNKYYKISLSTVYNCKTYASGTCKTKRKEIRYRVNVNGNNQIKLNFDKIKYKTDDNITKQIENTNAPIRNKTIADKQSKKNEKIKRMDAKKSARNKKGNKKIKEYAKLSDRSFADVCSKITYSKSDVERKYIFNRCKQIDKKNKTIAENKKRLSSRRNNDFRRELGSNQITSAINPIDCLTKLKIMQFSLEHFEDHVQNSDQFKIQLDEKIISWLLLIMIKSEHDNSSLSAAIDSQYENTKKYFTKSIKNYGIPNTLMRLYQGIEKCKDRFPYLK